MTLLLRVNYRFYISLFICMATAPGTLSYILPSQMFKDTGVGSRQARLSIADWSSYNYREPEGSGTYAFGYDVDDAPTGNTQFREEERHTNGTVTGSYGYVDPFGITQIVRYVADEKGYRAKTESVRKNYVATFKDPARPNIERNNYLARPYQAPSSQPYYTPQGVYVNPVYPGNQQPYYNNNYRNFG